MDNEQDKLLENINAILSIGGKTQKRPQPKVIDDSIRQRSRKRKIRVTFPDGKVFCKSSVTITFTEVLRKIGPELAASVGLELCRYPVVIREEQIPEKHKSSFKLIDNGWYANDYGSDAAIKYRQLCVINDKLNLGLKIEIGEDIETDGTKGFKKTKAAKEDLLVKFEDGSYIGGENPIDTYRDTLQKIGFDMLMRKGLEIGNRKLISSFKQYNDQTEVENRVWLTIPSTTKEKVKWLKLIAMLLHIKLEITTI